MIMYDVIRRNFRRMMDDSSSKTRESTLITHQQLSMHIILIKQEFCIQRVFGSNGNSRSKNRYQVDCVSDTFQIFAS